MTLSIRIALFSIILPASGSLARQAAAAQADQPESAKTPDKPRLAVEFHQDFRDRALDHRTIQRVGTNSDQFVRPDREGLRIRIPAGLNNPEAVGVAPRCRIRGDFEITVAFSIVKADNPIRGYGVAATVWAETNTITHEAVTIERGIIPREGERFTSTRVSGHSLERKYDVRRAAGQVPIRQASDGAGGNEGHHVFCRWPEAFSGAAHRRARAGGPHARPPGSRDRDVGPFRRDPPRGARYPGGGLARPAAQIGGSRRFSQARTAGADLEGPSSTRLAVGLSLLIKPDSRTDHDDASTFLTRTT